MYKLSLIVSDYDKRTNKLRISSCESLEYAYGKVWNNLLQHYVAEKTPVKQKVKKMVKTSLKHIIRIDLIYPQVLLKASCTNLNNFNSKRVPIVERHHMKLQAW